MFSKLLIFIWKDFLIARRSKLWTLFELLIPAIFIVLYALLCKEVLDTIPVERKGSENNFPSYPYSLVDNYENDENKTVVRNESIKLDISKRDYEAFEYHWINTLNISLTRFTADDWNDEDSDDRSLLQKYYKIMHRINTEYLVKPLGIDMKKWKMELFGLPSRPKSHREILMVIIVPVFSISLLMIVIGITRNIVMEKVLVKPYLTAMGLTSWDFYLSHYTFSLIKSLPVFMLSIAFMIYSLQESVVFFIFVIFYVLAAVSFATLVSVFFKKTNRAIEGVFLLWIAATLIPMLFTVPSKSWQTLLVSLDMHYAFMYFTLVAADLRLDGVDLSISNMFYSTGGIHFSCGVYMLILIFDAIWMFVAALYLDVLIEKISSIGFCNLIFGKRKSAGADCETLLGHDSAEIEDTRLNCPTDLIIDKVVKVYDTGEIAVNGLSLRAIRGQVSVLLGHNGCGKSTTFSMISGIQHPTEGRIEICGLDSVKDRNQCLKFIGFCPQYNPLYDKLTVWEHLKLVHKLKGNTEVEFEEEAEELTNAIGLYEKRDGLSSSLSGGMKRKLCICMALIGGSKVVLLDEPTAGIDIDARVQVQNMLEKCKENRTILLTTHYMDEAEKLGDWIFVMSHGRLGACGTSAFLKKQYGDGYLLTVVLKAENERSTKLLTSVCQILVDGATLKRSRGRVVEFNLPEVQKPSFLKLLQALDAIKLNQFEKTDTLPDELRSELQTISIHSMGLSLNSLEQVFIKIIEKCDNLTDLDGKKKGKNECFETLMSAKQEESLSGLLLIVSQFTALYKKRLIYTFRNWSQLICQILLPLLVLYIAFGNAVSESKLVEHLDVSNFPESTVYARFYEDNPKVMTYLRKYKNLHIRERSIDSRMEDLILESKRDGLQIGFILTQANATSFRIDFNAAATRGDFMVIQLFSNLVLLMEHNEKNAKIRGTIVWKPEEVRKASMSRSFHLSYVIVFVFALFVSPISIFLIDERVSKFEHQQDLTPLTRNVRWMANYFYDVFVVGSVVTISWIFLLIEDIFIDFGWVAMLFFAYFFAFIPIIYIFSRIIRTPSKAMMILLTLQIMTVVLPLLLYVFIIHKTHFPYEVNESIYIGLSMMFPSGPFLVGLARMYNTNVAELMINNLLTYRNYDDWDGVPRDFASIIAIGTLASILFYFTTIVKFTCYTPKKEPTPNLVDLSAETLNNGMEDKKRYSICAEKIVKDYRSFRALDGLTVKIEEGECFGLLGVNGAGKTTFFEILTGSRTQSGGTATINDVDTNGKVIAGYCPQFDAVLMDLTGEEALKIMAQIHGYMNYSEIANYALTCVDMQEHKKKLIKFCSGGQKRRISIAVALLTRSNCFILDEPTAGIDPKVRREIWEILEWEQQRAGCAILLSSHSMEECEALCQRIGILNKGRLVALGTSQELKSKYGNSYTMTLILHNANDVDRIKKEVATRIPTSKLETRTVNKIITWKLEKKVDDTWSGVWKNVEQLANELKVKDFMLVQSSLEDTFLALAENRVNDSVNK